MNDTRQHSTAIDGLEVVSQVVRRYAEIEKIYLRDQDPVDNRDLEAELVQLYKWVLEYEARAACQFNRNTAIRIARNIVEADGWAGIIESIKKSDLTCGRFISIVDAKDQRKGRTRLERVLAEQDMMMKKLLQTSRDQDETNRNLWSKHQEWRQTDEERNCHQVFRTSEYERHKSRNPDRVEETCKWFLGHHNFKQWLESEGSSLLWVSADPGCGKSVLSKSLIDHELRCTAFRTSCYFFFKDDNPDQKNVANALCALLHQLFSAKPILLKHALPEFGHNGNDMSRIFDALWRILVRAAADPEAGEVICVLDALDECEESGRHELIERFRRFFDNPDKHEPNKTRLKFLVTSRPYVDIERRFKPLTSVFPTVRLAGEEETELISREIEKVIKAKVQEIGKSLDLNDSIRMTLEAKLLGVAHRTYLWLKLVFDVITEQLQVTEKRLVGIVDRLPETVEKAYTAILNRSTDRLRAKTLLHIIVAARRPLSLREMNVALAIEEHSRSYEDLDLEPEKSFRVTVRNLCGLFVSVIDSKIFLIHQTAKEFLIRDEATMTPIDHSGPSFEYWKHSLQLTESDLVLAKACIMYLLFDVFESEPFTLEPEAESDAAQDDGAQNNEPTNYREIGVGDVYDEVIEIEVANNEEIGIEVPNEIDSETSETTEINVQPPKSSILDPFSSECFDTIQYDSYADLHGFLNYSATYWVSHFRTAKPSEEMPLIRSALRVCDPRSKRIGAWLYKYNIIHDCYYYGPSTLTTFTQLMIVSYLELENLVQPLLRENVDINEKLRSFDVTALSIAANMIHVNMVRLLLEKGAHPKLELSEALVEFMWKLSLMNNPRIAALDEVMVSSQYEAIRVDMVTIGRLMLAEEAFTSHGNTSGRTAQIKASTRYYRTLTELLLQRSDDLSLVQLRDSESLAYDKQVLDKITVIRLLLEYGADPEAKDPEGMTALDILIFCFSNDLSLGMPRIFLFT